MHGMEVYWATSSLSQEKALRPTLCAVVINHRINCLDLVLVTMQICGLSLYKFVDHKMPLGAFLATTSLRKAVPITLWLFVLNNLNTVINLTDYCSYK